MLTDNPFIRNHGRKLVFFAPVAVGVVVLLLAALIRQPPAQSPATERPVSARVITVQEVSLMPRAIGYGSAMPGRIWEGVAEVGGKIVEIHPQLQEGAIIGKGEVLLRIDPTDYRLAVSRTEADIQSATAQLAELSAREKNTEASLKIEQRSLKLSSNDLDRKRTLFTQGTVSQAAVDQEERKVLTGQQSAQSLKNTLNLIPAERDVLIAQMEQYQTRLDAARLDLERTTLTAPFDCRIAQVNVQETQYAGQGKVLVVADDIGTSEVTAQIPIGRLINLMPLGMTIPDEAAGVMGKLRNLLGFSAIVRLRGSAVKAQWQARFSRISHTIDPQTRTAGVIVAVDDPYHQVVSGSRPPLTKNMFVEVELRGIPRPGQIVVPRSSLHGGKVYIINDDNRLEIRDLEIAFEQTNFSVIASGLKVGEKLVISDLVPAIDGMLLAPVLDLRAAEDLAASAEGSGPVR